MLSYIVMISCFFAASSISTINAAPDRKYNNQSEIIDDMLDHMFSCMQELEINPDVCGELLMKDKDHSDKKYDGCKCLCPCIAKRMGTMNPVTGKWNLARFKEISALIENEMLKNEAEIIEKECQDDILTHCEAGYAIMKCALDHSPMVQDLAKNYVATKENMEKDTDNA